jgi:hypothetical protein
MSWTRFSIAALMGVVLFVALGFAALKNANAFWASATFTVAVVMISLALLGAIARKGRARMIWGGFAAFGWACLILWLARPQISPIVGMGGGGFGGGLMSSPSRRQPMSMPPLLTEWGLLQLQAHITPAAGSSMRPMFRSVYVAQIFQSLDIIVFGFFGAILGRFVALKNEGANS